MKPSTVARRLLGLSADSFPTLAAARFGAQADMDLTWAQFEPVASTLVDSFYASLDVRDPERVKTVVDAYPPELRGIAYEGAGMALALWDSLVPGSRLSYFAHGPGRPYRALVYIGAGLVLPRLPRSTARFLESVDPFHRWFVMDGFGFFEGFFHWEETTRHGHQPDLPGGYAHRAYDQGLGRSMWFSTGANTDRIVDTVSSFDPGRRPDLWGGLGLACAYAAGVMDADAMRTLMRAAGPYAPDFAAGAAVASTFRLQTRQPAPHTDLACRVIWGMHPDDVARLAVCLDESRAGMPTVTSYPRWRDALRDDWSQRTSQGLPLFEQHQAPTLIGAAS